jgi:hypothetical protein
MKKSKVLYDFVMFAAAFLIEFARNVVTMMTGNASFPNPYVTLAQITAAANDLEAKFKAALNGDRQLKANMRIALNTLITLLKKQAAYVNLIADGSDAVILSAGYHASQQPDSKLLPEFNVIHGKNSGEALAKHKAVKGAKSYVWQRAADPLPTSDSGWAYVGFTTKCKFTDTGLVPGTKHWYRVAWITKDGLSAWSAPMMIIAM